MRQITSLKILDKRKQAFMIELEGLPWREVDIEVVLKFHLHEGDEISPEQQSAIDKENDFVHARRRAVNFCVKQPRTRREVLRLLERKNTKQETVDRVMRELMRQNLLRDKDVARRGVRRAERLKIGPLRTEADLAQRGVNRQEIQEEIEPVRDPQWQRQQAKNLAEKRLQRLEELDTQTQRRRLTDYLMRRGFEAEIVQEVVEQAIRHQGQGES